MSRSYRLILYMVPIAMLVSGCAFVPSLIYEGIASTVDQQKEQYKDIEFTITKGFMREDLKGIKSVAFLVSSGLSNPLDQGAGMVFSDNLSKEFLKEGFEVVERQTIEDILNEKKLQNEASSNPDLSEVGGIIGVNGIFRGSVQTGYGYSRGFLGIGAEMKSGITAATLKLIDVNTGKIMLVTSATYKKPKPSSEVAKNIASAFKAYQNKGTEAAKEQ